MDFFTIVEMIGTIAFAMSGALRAIEKDMDYYGIVVLGITTSVGGGIIRDILINQNLPAALVNPIYIIISILAAVVVIIFYNYIIPFNQVLYVFDAVGLAAFTAIGSELAVRHGFQQPFIIIILAVLTGTGGGILRDLFANEIPYVFHKEEIYAVATIVGSFIFIISYNVYGSNIAIHLSFIVTLLFRLFCMKNDIHLKKVTNKENRQKS